MSLNEEEEKERKSALQSATFSTGKKTQKTRHKPQKTPSFCYPCIRRWSDVESACPLCKRRFSKLSKVVLVGGGGGERAEKASKDGERQQQLPSPQQQQQQLTRSALLSLSTASVVETLTVPERTQRGHYETAEAAEAAARLAELACVCCGGGGDDHLLLLCDGCDAAVSCFFFFFFAFFESKKK